MRGQEAVSPHLAGWTSSLWALQAWAVDWADCRSCVLIPQERESSHSGRSVVI